MMAVATPQDVADRLGRPLTADEQRQAQVLLDDVQAMLIARVPNLVDRANGDAQYERAVVLVETSAVARVLRNPDGFRSESEGDYSYSTDTRVAAGFLTILPDEWSLLGWRKGAFVIAPKVDTDAGSAWWQNPAHWPQYGNLQDAPTVY